jgi:glycosyltransferase involved in cell wall biosynthesis
MQDVMSASDVLFLSSQMEGIPCVFFEAMAAKVPVIGPDVGGISELLLDNVTGCTHIHTHIYIHTYIYTHIYHT